MKRFELLAVTKEVSLVGSSHTLLSIMSCQLKHVFFQIYRYSRIASDQSLHNCFFLCWNFEMNFKVSMAFISSTLIISQVTLKFKKKRTSQIFI